MTKRGAVTVLGLGDMGGALAATVAERGWTVTAWNRGAERAAALAGSVTRIASTPAEAVAASPVTVVCLSHHAATMAVLDAPGVGATLAGRDVVQLSTMTSAESSALGGRLVSLGAGYLDGQILDFPDDVREGRANIVLSGPPALTARHRDMLEAMAGRVHVVGERNGAAPSFDKAHLSFAIGSYVAFLQGAAMCARAGADLAAWCDYNLRYLGDGPLGREIAILAEQVKARSYDEGLEATMAVWQGAVAKIAAECAALGLDEAHIAPLRRYVDEAVASGDGDKEFGALFELLSRPKG